MGGSTSKVFKAAAREVSQVNQLEDQRKKDMSIYTIIIVMCFFVFLAIIIILDKTIFTSFLDLQTTQTAQIGNELIMSTVNPMQLQYALYSFVYMQSIGSGVLAGFMMDGKLSSGIRYSCILGRARNFQSNSRNLRNASIYLTANLINRREMHRKQGLPLGDESQLKPLFGNPHS